MTEFDKNSLMPKCYNPKSKPSLFCPGCGQSIFMKQLGLVIDEMEIKNKSTIVIDIGCSLLAWNYYNIDTVQSHHGRVVPLLVGYKLSREKRVAIGIVGDGGGYAIGLQSLIHAAFRNNPISIFLLNNTGYSMTGGQSAPTTIPGEVTTTTPKNKSNQQIGKAFHGPELLRHVASTRAFIGRASVSNPEMLKLMIKKTLSAQIENASFGFLEILSICPTNWKTKSRESFNFLSKLEKEYPLGEVIIKNEK